jgi:hypothetical protein
MLLDFFSHFFLIEIHRPNAMVHNDDKDRPEVSLLFVVGFKLVA